MKYWAKYIGLLIGVVLLVSTSNGQTHFQKQVVGNFQNNFIYSTHTKTADDGFWIFGKSSLTLGVGENYIIKTDSLGDTLFVKQYSDIASASFSSIVNAPDGGVYMVGIISTPTALIREFLIVCKLDANGNIEWTDSYTGENYKQPFACLHNGVLHIGGIMGEGFTANYDKYVYVIRISADGILLSNDFRKANNREEITDIAVNQAGFTVLSGVTYRLNSKGNVLFVSADPGGNIRFFNDINIDGISGTYSRANAITTKGDEVLLTGQLYGTGNNNTFVIKLDNALATTGERVILGGDYSFGLFTIDATNTAIVAGGNGEIDALSTIKNLIVSFNDNLSLKWAKVYGYGNGYKLLSALNIRDNGDITGTGRLNLNHFYGISIIRANSSGFTGCLENDYALTTDIATISFPQYLPNSYAPYVSEFGGGINLSGVTNFEIEKICNADSCKANFELITDSICTNTCITINNLSKNATKWQWSFSGANLNTFDGKNPNQVCYTISGTKTIKLRVSNSLNSDSIEKTIYVYPLPIANAGVDTTICQGQQIRLQGSGGKTYQWLPTTFKNSPSLPNPRVNPDTTVRYYLTVTDSNKCEDTDSVLVSVINLPFTKKIDTTICEDKRIAIDAENNGFTYLWSTGATSKITNIDTGKHYVVISNACFADTSFFTIRGKNCNPLYFIPNAFSPNGDGVNDIFSVYSDNIVWVNMTIYNRWGEVVFKEEGISPSWNGGYKNTSCTSNLYLYIIELRDKTGKKYNEKGTIILLH